MHEGSGLGFHVGTGINLDMLMKTGAYAYDYLSSDSFYKALNSLGLIGSTVGGIFNWFSNLIHHKKNKKNTDELISKLMFQLEDPKTTLQQQKGIIELIYKMRNSGVIPPKSKNMSGIQMQKYLKTLREDVYKREKHNKEPIPKELYQDLDKNDLYELNEKLDKHLHKQATHVPIKTNAFYEHNKQHKHQTSGSLYDEIEDEKHEDEIFIEEHKFDPDLEEFDVDKKTEVVDNLLFNNPVPTRIKFNPHIHSSGRGFF